MTEELERSQIVQSVRQWLEEVVIGLNLCPFVVEPLRQQQLRIRVSDAKTEEELLTDLQAELILLERVHPDILETTLLVVPYLFAQFEDYNEFLTLADLLLQEFGWEGDYQIASFHPHYRFAGTELDDPENLTNCSPYPILHILREDSVSLALAAYPNPEQIPERNIKTVQALNPDDKKVLFPYLKDAPEQNPTQPIEYNPLDLYPGQSPTQPIEYNPLDLYPGQSPTQCPESYPDLNPESCPEQWPE